MQHLHEETNAGTARTCVFFFFIICFRFKRSLLYLHGWNLEVGFPVQAVGHLEGSGAVHLPHTFQGNHIQLELRDQIKTYAE